MGRCRHHAYLPLVRACLGPAHLTAVAGFVLALTVTEWFRPGQTRALASTRFTMCVLHARLLLRLLALAVVHPLGCLCAGAGLFVSARARVAFFSVAHDPSRVGW